MILKIFLKKIDKAELILHRQNEDLSVNLTKEFSRALPFVVEKFPPINNKRTLCKHFDLCQMLRDMISISEETNWNTRTSVQSIYRSIGAYITHVKSESDTFQEVKRLVFSKVMNSDLKEHDMSLLNVYEVRRLDESSNFNRQVFFLNLICKP